MTTALRNHIPHVIAATLTRGDEEKYVEFVLEYDSPADVYAARKAEHPGWQTAETWSILPSDCRTDSARAKIAEWQQQAQQAIAAGDPLPSYKELFSRADAIGERYAA